MKARNMLNLLNKLYNVKTENNAVKKSFLFGIFKTKYFIEMFNFEFRFCGIVLLKTKINKGYEKFYILGIPFFIKKSSHKLYNKILDKIDGKYTDIYINFNCSGETYLFLTFFNSFNKGKKPLLIATKPYHVDLFNMMCPEIPYFYIPGLEKLRGYDNIFQEQYKNVNFYNILPMKHFINLEKQIIKGTDIHYYDEILKTVCIKNSEINSQKPLISEQVKQSALDKAKKINLNIDNFIFICPESQSNIDLDSYFWPDLINCFFENGTDVFMNVIKLSPLFGSAKTCFLTIQEAYCLASLSKGIIGLRSGILEPLSTLNNIPLVCLYSDFKDRGVLKSIPAKKVMNSFSLKKLPNTSYNITEYCIEDYSNDQLKQMITEVLL